MKHDKVTKVNIKSLTTIDSHIFALMLVISCVIKERRKKNKSKIW